MYLSQGMLESDTFGKIIVSASIQPTGFFRPKYLPISIDLKFLRVWVDKNSTRLSELNSTAGSKFLPNYGRRPASWDNFKMGDFHAAFTATFHLSRQLPACQTRVHTHHRDSHAIAQRKHEARFPGVARATHSNSREKLMEEKDLWGDEKMRWHCRDLSRAVDTIGARPCKMPP